MILVEKKEEKVKVNWYERSRVVMLIVAGYVLFYLVGRVLWVPMKNMTVLGWLTTQSPYDIQEYLYGWLFDNNFIWYGAVISALLGMIGKYKAALISYIGFVGGYMLGYFLGPNPKGAAIGQGHYGWAIWGMTFLVSIVVGVFVEKHKKFEMDIIQNIVEE